MLIRNEDPWFRITAMGAGVLAFLHETLKSMLEKEVDNQIKKKELEDMEKEAVAKDEELQRKELQLQHVRDEVDTAQRRWF